MKEEKAFKVTLELDGRVEVVVHAKNAKIAAAKALQRVNDRQLIHEEKYAPAWKIENTNQGDSVEEIEII